MDSLPPGAIPADQFEEAAPSRETPEDIKALGLPEGTIPGDQFEEDEKTTPGQKPVNSSKAYIEGMGRAMTFGGTDALQHGIRSVAEKYSNDPDFWADSDKDVADRKDSIAGKMGEASGIIGGFMSGSGAPGMIQGFAKAAVPEATTAATVLGRMGAAGVASAIESGAIQGSDEISKALLGKGDPETPVSSALAHIGAAGLFGFGTGAIFSGVAQGSAKGLTALENAKMGDRAQETLQGMGLANKAHIAGVPAEEAEAYIKNYFKELGVEDFNYNKYKAGVKAYYAGPKAIVNGVVDTVADLGVGTAVGVGVGKIFGTGVGGAAGGAAATATQKYLSPIVESIVGKPLIGMANKYATPTIMYALSKGQTTGLFNALNHGASIAKGARAIGKGVDAVLKAGTPLAIDFAASDKDKKKITDYIDQGGTQKEMQDSLQAQPPEPEQGFAEGGEIDQGAEQDGGSIASLYPNQDMLMNAAKARMSDYLSSLKPSDNPAKLPFDRKPTSTDQDRVYDNAVGIAASPLSILKDIKNGSLKAEQVKHFTSLYPELHSHLSKRFTEGIMNAQMDEEPIPYRTRQALSLFMGTALDSTMTPPSILAAQSVFLPKPAPVMPNGKKGSPAKMGKEAKTYKTQEQAAESDRSSRD